MKVFLKRLVSIVLAVMMLVSCLPVSALAEEPIGEEPIAEDPIVEVPDEAPAPELEPELTEIPDEEDPYVKQGTDEDDEEEIPDEDGNVDGEIPDEGGEGDDDPDKTEKEIEELSAAIKAEADSLFLGNHCQIALRADAVNGPYDHVLAGDIVSYQVTYNFAASPTWSDSYDKPEKLFDFYRENIITVRLPAGLLLDNAGNRSYSTTENADGSHTYTFHLGTMDSSSAEYEFTLAVYVCGNGTDHAINSYTMTDAVNFSTKFTVLNKLADPYADVEEYTQEVSASLDSVTTYSPDEWAIEKEAVSATADKEAMTATVVYKLHVGLLDRTTGEMLRNDTDYTDLRGRDAFEVVNGQPQVSITEDLTAMLTKGSAAATDLGDPTSVTIRQDKTGASQIVSEGTPIVLDGNLALNTVRAKGSSDVGDVGTYTNYTVTAVYPLTDDMIAHFENPTSNKIDFTNDVTLNYKLADMESDSDSADAKEDLTLPARVPASVTLDKEFINYLGAQDTYKNEYGAISYTISSKNGETFKLYNKVSDGVYTAATDADTSFSITAGTKYYLPADITYVVAESLNENQSRFMEKVDADCRNLEHKPTEGEDYTALLVNSEKAGTITVKKVDDLGAVLGGVPFTLSSDSYTVTDGKKLTSSADGTASWARIPYGTYTLTEDQVPDNYTSVDGTSWMITLNADHKTVTQEVTNKKNLATISLTKKVGITESGMKNADSSFEGTFVLQRKIEGGDWAAVSQDIYQQAVPTGVNGTGDITVHVPAFDAEGNIYTYRFVETIPEGYFALDRVSGTTATSEEVDLVDESGEHAERETVSVTMKNYQKVKVSVNKKFFDPVIDSSGSLIMQENTNPTTTVKLYSWNGTQMSELPGGGKTVSSNTSAVWEDLPCVRVVDGQIETIDYYVREADVTGYILDAAKTGGSTKVYNGDTYYHVTVNAAENAKTLYNIKQRVPVIIYKKNYYTKKFVSGAGVTVTKQNDTSGTVILQNEMIETSAGLVAYLEPGAKYNLVETVNNTGLTQVNATETEPILIDLSDIAQMKYSGYTIKTYTVYNKPDPAIQITKVSKSKTTKVLKEAKFTVFEKDGDTYKKVLIDGNPVIITGDGSVSNIRLPAGTYYVAETTVPKNYIDPNKVPDEYIGKISGTTYVSGTTDDGITYTFAEMKVEDAAISGTTDNIASFTFKNVYNLASMTVQKYVDGKIAKLSGVTVKISYNDGTGEKTPTAQTDATGKVTFSNLPVYDTNGSRIVYTIKEDGVSANGELTAAALKDKYYFVADGQTATLTVSTTTTTAATTPSTMDSSIKTLRVENATYTALESQKVYRHTWEYPNTLQEYPMGGAEIGLYELDGETWIFVKKVTTQDSGAIHFDHLRRDKSYAIVELGCDDEYMFPYEEGTSGGYKDFAGTLTEISASDLSKYSARILPAETSGSTRASSTTLPKMINQDHWVQFDITKYLDHDVLDPENPVHGTSIDFDGDDKDTKYNNAVYQLFRYEVPENTTNLTFDLEAPGDWELMGTYISGSLYGPTADGWERLTGKFMTDVDQMVSENVVYMLVETSSGPGAGIINPNFQYTFYQHTANKYTAAVDGETVRDMTYLYDAPTVDNLLNSRGTGTGDAVMVTNLRIAKWWDDFNADGSPKRVYQPLPNASFEVVLKTSSGEKVLETLTVGLDSNVSDTENVKAWAQGVAYGLRMDPTTDDTGILFNYAEEGEESGTSTKSYSVPVVSLNDANSIYGVKVYLREVEAPKGFTYDKNEHAMYLCFVMGASESFSDAFFVTEADSNDPLAENQRGAIAWATSWSSEDDSGSAGSKFRIVDYPMQDSLVRVAKFGYTPTSNTLGKTSDELYAADVGTPLGGVQMALQKYDEGTSKWEYWDYLNKMPTTDASQYSFTTRADGSYLFAKGLPAGKYRIFETSIGTANSAYEIAYTSSRSRVFTVDTDPVDVYMYNPTKVDFSVLKQDADGNALSGTTFTLTPESGTALTGETDGDGKFTFENLASGTYTLTESKAGYSSQYLTAYVNTLPEAQREQLLALIGENGAHIGYNYQTAGTDGDKDVVIGSIDFGSVNFEFTVKNPELCDLSLKKVNEENKNTVLSGATFQIYYKPFDTWSGVMTASAPDAKWTGWTNKGTKTTNNKGLIALTDQEPGIYAFYETAAPSGYTIIKTSDNKDIIYYVIVTGGMSVTVTGLPATAIAKKADGTTFTVDTLFTNPTAAFTAINRPRKNLQAVKIVDAGELSKDGLTWSVQLDLYAYSDHGNLLGSATITDATEGPVTFKTTSGTNTYVTQGSRYWVQETVTSSPASDYAIKQVEVNDTVVDPTNGRYPIQINTSEPITVTVTNSYLHGRVEFKKVDYKDQTKLLSGASFTVCAADGVTPITGATVTEKLDDEGKGTGIYVAELPLSKAENTQYTIVETDAPEHYLLQDGIKLDVFLSAENNVIDLEEGKQLTNLEGWFVTVEKYDNVHGAANAAPVGKNEATFTIYHRDSADPETWSVVPDNTLSTDENGKLTWTLMPDETYAFTESSSVAKFIGIESVWRGEVQQTLRDIQVGETTIKNCVVIENLSEDIVFKAYNKPASQIKIIKKDMGGYPENVIPSTDFVIYELEKPLSQYDAPETAIAGLTSAAIVYRGNTQMNVNESEKTTYDVWTGRDLTKNYVAVETLVQPFRNGPYDTLNKDDARVVWYQAIDAGAELSSEYTFKNVYGDAAVTLKKEVVANETAASVKEAAGTENAAVKVGNDYVVDSLLKGSRKVTYKLTPTVTSHNQPLSSFVLNDTGLTFTGNTDTTYTIDSITVGKASHVTTNISGVQSGMISAEIIWNGDETNKTPISDLSTDQTVAAPANASSFSIRYYSQGVQNASERYSLGADFHADPVLVNVTVNQLPEGSEGNTVAETTAFTNGANVKLTYPKWKADGTGTDLQEKTDSKTAEIKVDTIKLPRVNLVKTALSTTESTMQVGDTIYYLLAITNDSASEEDFVNPVVVDMLPTGVTYDGSWEVTADSDVPDFNVTVTRYTGEPTMRRVISETESTVIGDMETAVVVSMEGTLHPGETVTLKLGANVGASSVIYGDKIHNFAFLSSNAHSYYTATNPHGYSFQNDVGQYPGVLADEAALLGTIADKREEGLHKCLSAYTGIGYAWVKTSHEVTLVSKGSVTPVKSIRGDQDPGFSSEDAFLATATRTNSTAGALINGGWVDYRLNVLNGTESQKRYLVISDAISKVGDSVGSVWNTIMDRITSVTFAGKEAPAGKYWIYYYTGEVGTADAAAETAVNTANKWVTNEAWPQLSALPGGWQLASDVSADNLKNVTAFAIVFDKTMILQKGESITVTYHTLTEDVPSDSDFAKIAFENANNKFKTNWGSSLERLESNTVSVTLMDEPVKVAGDLWIDENWDGMQDGKKPADKYDNYAIVQALKNAITFELTDERKASVGTKTDEANAVTPDGVGESIKHFSFTELGAALQVRDPLYIDNTLNTGALKTTDPYNYSLKATVSDTSLLDIFKITLLGTGHYMSDDPDQEYGNNTYDNNFYPGSTAGTFITNPFYLRYSARPDQTKDIGFIMVRDLDVYKKAADDALVMVEGAKFKIYGPYAEKKADGTGNALTFTQAADGSYVYDPDGTVTELVTGADGHIHVSGLNWWREYVIEEAEAGSGYELEGAAASAAAGTSIEKLADNKWILKIPGQDRLTKADGMTVTNVRKCQTVLEAKKILTGGILKLKGNDFAFDLYDAENKFIETKSNDLNGKITFSTITYDRAGTYIYYIRERIPDPVPDGFTYSHATITAKVEVKWDSTQKKLTATPTYSIEGKAADPEFINDYTPVPFKLQLPVKKSIEGNARPEDWKQTFTFTLSPKADEEEGTTEVTLTTPMPEDGVYSIEIVDEGTRYYAPIEYTEAGIYEYTLKEVAEDTTPAGYTYDLSERAITVTVTDVNGKLQGVLKVNNVEKTEVEFINKYFPTPVNVELPVQKTVTGSATPADKTFHFILEAESEGAPMPADTLDGKSTLDIVGSGSGTFGVIHYTAAGTYKYKATEFAAGEPGYTYDNTVHHYTVVVTDTESVLSATWTVDGTTETVAKYTNEYTPSETEVGLKVQKTVTGKTRPENWKQTFTFTLTPVDGAPMPQKDGADQTTVEIRDNGVQSFNNISYTAAGTYNYTLQETVTDRLTGYSYDTNVYNIKVVVTDSNGQLVARAYIGDTEITDKVNDVITVSCAFENTYQPTPVPVALPVCKLFSTVGDDVDPLLEERSFTFHLVGGNGAPMPASGGETVTVKEAGGWSGMFGQISFDTAGTYSYTVTEDRTNPYPNYTYDESTHTYTVTVTDNGGSLSAVWKLDNGAVTDQQKTASFTNPYTPTPTTIRADVQKVITGNARPDGEKQTFTFTLTGLDGAPMPTGAQNGVKTVQTTDEQTVSFGEIKYEHNGTYWYTVQETAGSASHYSYDTTERKFKVVVTDSIVRTDSEAHTELHATISSSDESVEISETEAGVKVVKTVITNTYTPDAAALGIKVRKTMLGNVRPANWKHTFTFTLTPSDGAPMPKVSESSDENQTFVEITDQGEVSFNSIRFTAAGTYTYTLTEAAVDKTGYSVVVGTHTIHANVADVGGEMKVKAYLDDEAVPENAVVSAEVSPEFTNRYDNQPIKLVLPVKKEVAGKTPSTAKQFEFVLETEETGTPMPAGTGNHVFVTGSNTGWFGEIEYSAAGTYTYTVHEVIPEDPDGDGKIDGYTYDGTTHTYAVTVTDTEGVLSAAWTLDGKALESAAEGTTTEALAGPVAEFTNTYGPDSATVQIPVRKIVQGPAPADKDFVFELKPVGTAPMPADAEQGVSTVTVHGSDTNTFGIITYEDAGEYSYTVSEIDGKLPGYTYDTTVFTVDVHVTDDGRGHLSATYNVLINEQVIREIAFTNPYEPDETTAELKVQKTVNGNDRPEDWKQTFEFTLTGQNGAPMPTGTTAGSTEKKITIVDNDTKTFGTITYTAAGTYTYELKETVRTVTGYVFDETTHTVRVVVSDENGQLTAKAYLAGDPETEIGELIEGVLTVTREFINTYEPDTVKIQLPAKKTLTGNPVPAGEDKEFTFELTAGEGTPMPAADGIRTIVRGTGTSQFGEIEYAAAGTYTYTVKESVPTDAVNNKKDGYTYDTTVHTYVVTVTDNKGQLEASWKLDDIETTGGTAEFVNDYTPDPTDTVLLVSKTVEGNDRPEDWQQTFTFTLTGKDGAPMPTGTETGSPKSITIEDNGSETFGSIRFTTAGTYDYELAETVQTIQGYTFDGAVRTIRVVVTDTASKLSAKAYLGETEIGELVGGVLTVTSPFVNNYNPDDAEVVLEVRKTMEGQDRPEDWQQTFKFTLEAVEDAPMPAEGQTFVEITDNGLKSFNKIVYTEAGTYKYHLSEEKIDKNGYTFDETVHEIQVIVTDNKGVLEAETSIDGVQTVTGEFTNKYTANPVKIKLPVKKTLSGNPIPEGEEKEFTFILKAKNEEPMPEYGKEVVTVIGAAEGEFGEIEFTEPGTYSYTVEEVEGTEPGYAYDKATHTFTATVTDNKGDLEAVWTVDNTDGTVAVFTNTYIPDATALAIPVEKKVEGSPRPSDKTFTFLLKGSTATTPMPEGTVNGESRVTIVGSGESAFPLITYKEAGYYTYTVTEIVGNDTGYVYDKTQYTVNVTVIDKAAKLSASCEIQDAEKIVFTNTYHPEPAKLVIPVRKNISGYANTRVKFTFDLTAVTRNAPMPKESTISIVGEGRAEFDAIKFSEAGEYVYELRERYSNSDRFIDDTAVRRIVVKAEDHDGNITLSWTINGRSVNEAVFTNIYIPPEETVLVPPVVKQITGEKPKQASTFTFVLQAQSTSNPMPAGSVRGTKEITITGAGSSDFGSITFTSAGTYVYTVSERNTGADNYTYDTTVYTVTYHVEERGGRLVVDTTIRNGRAAASKIVFVNKYVPPREKLPQTGALWWPVGLMLTAGLALILIGLRRRRGYRNGQ